MWGGPLFLGKAGWAVRNSVHLKSPDSLLYRDWNKARETAQPETGSGSGVGYRYPPHIISYARCSDSYQDLIASGYQAAGRNRNGEGACGDINGPIRSCRENEVGITAHDAKEIRFTQDRRTGCPGYAVSGGALPGGAWGGASYDWKGAGLDAGRSVGNTSNGHAEIDRGSRGYGQIPVVATVVTAGVCQSVPVYRYVGIGYRCRPGAVGKDLDMLQPTDGIVPSGRTQYCGLDQGRRIRGLTWGYTGRVGHHCGGRSVLVIKEGKITGTPAAGGAGP